MKTRNILLILTIILVFTLSAKYSTAVCVTPTEDILITGDTTLCTGTYYLNDSNQNGAIRINANNIILDCNNTTIIGTNLTFSEYSPSSIGIDTNLRTNITIKNCIIKGYDWGIYIRKSSNSNIINNQIINISSNGILADRTSNISISNNTINGTYINCYSGTYAQRCNTTANGIYLSENNNSIINNTLDLVTNGIVLYGGRNSSIINNRITNIGTNGYAIKTEESTITSDNNNISNNQINGGGWDAILLNGYHNILDNNTIVNFYHHGIDTIVNDYDLDTIYGGYNTIRNNYINDYSMSDPEFNSQSLCIFIIQSIYNNISGNICLNSTLTLGRHNNTYGNRVFNNTIVSSELLNGSLVSIASPAEIYDNTLIYRNSFGYPSNAATIYISRPYINGTTITLNIYNNTITSTYGVSTIYLQSFDNYSLNFSSNNIDNTYIEFGEGNHINYTYDGEKTFILNKSNNLRSIYMSNLYSPYNDMINVSNQATIFANQENYYMLIPSNSLRIGNFVADPVTNQNATLINLSLTNTSSLINCTLRAIDDDATIVANVKIFNNGTQVNNTNVTLSNNTYYSYTRPSGLGSWYCNVTINSTTNQSNTITISPIDLNATVSSITLTNTSTHLICSILAIDPDNSSIFANVRFFNNTVQVNNSNITLTNNTLYNFTTAKTDGLWYCNITLAGITNQSNILNITTINQNASLSSISITNTSNLINCTILATDPDNSSIQATVRIFNNNTEVNNSNITLTNNTYHSYTRPSGTGTFYCNATINSITNQSNILNITQQVINQNATLTNISLTNTSSLINCTIRAIDDDTTIVANIKIYNNNTEVNNSNITLTNNTYYSYTRPIGYGTWQCNTTINSTTNQSNILTITEPVIDQNASLSSIALTNNSNSIICQVLALDQDNSSIQSNIKLYQNNIEVNNSNITLTNNTYYNFTRAKSDGTFYCNATINNILNQSNILTITTPAINQNATLNSITLTNTSSIINCTILATDPDNTSIQATVRIYNNQTEVNNSNITLTNNTYYSLTRPSGLGTWYCNATINSITNQSNTINITQTTINQNATLNSIQLTNTSSLMNCTILATDDDSTIVANIKIYNNQTEVNNSNITLTNNTYYSYTRPSGLGTWYCNATINSTINQSNTITIDAPTIINQNATLSSITLTNNTNTIICSIKALDPDNSSIQSNIRIYKNNIEVNNTNITLTNNTYYNVTTTKSDGTFYCNATINSITNQSNSITITTINQNATLSSIQLTNTSSLINCTILAIDPDNSSIQANIKIYNNQTEVNNSNITLTNNTYYNYTRPSGLGTWYCNATINSIVNQSNTITIAENQNPTLNLINLTNTSNLINCTIRAIDPDNTSIQANIKLFKNNIEVNNTNITLTNNTYYGYTTSKSEGQWYCNATINQVTNSSNTLFIPYTLQSASITGDVSTINCSGTVSTQSSINISFIKDSIQINSTVLNSSTNFSATTQGAYGTWMCNITINNTINQTSTLALSEPVVVVEETTPTKSRGGGGGSGGAITISEPTNTISNNSTTNSNSNTNTTTQIKNNNEPNKNEEFSSETSIELETVADPDANVEELVSQTIETPNRITTKFEAGYIPIIALIFISILMAIGYFAKSSRKTIDSIIPNIVQTIKITPQVGGIYKQAVHTTTTHITPSIGGIYSSNANVHKNKIMEYITSGKHKSENILRLIDTYQKHGFINEHEATQLSHHLHH